MTNVFYQFYKIIFVVLTLWSIEQYICVFASQVVNFQWSLEFVLNTHQALSECYGPNGSIWKFEMSLLGGVLCPHQKKKKNINFYSCACHNVSLSMNQFFLAIYTTCNCTIWPLYKTSIWMSAWQRSFVKKPILEKGKSGHWALSNTEASGWLLEGWR